MFRHFIMMKNPKIMIGNTNNRYLQYVYPRTKALKYINNSSLRVVRTERRIIPSSEVKM